ncbi:energy-coupling factor ABC transporter ATP-binding protein [Neorhizobium galegae]|uniref:energy-coupling factor ABC transporter ATP-binding protein n=1 Tax=Neorhizobium galegae TaxID=399 RepID=UPI00126B24F1|nr:energy-coupling factor ABC transporter ATP-binding protein [Neorhizobium galegae]KAA9386152.1 energy-coupling factor ABC transporter ATP-binding protein [Neorhizobium galegae]KAB1113405.1 energy-coupling factor ABC transporter ATP-binding protein [Neorhizobium galegae]MCM2496362.1 energy-coupling factor ABC transporter ATP-binding protein [Neorhizobium galegae]MCQ1770502.1 energy-coupling factor ABC transporter ATP-binding protein [Neorhizobium galegae]MCQ1799994.1 energy-coupling factor AB
MDIRFEQAEARFEGRTVVHPLTLRLSERRIGVIGLNGSGKTTFARMINGLVLPAAGQVTVNGFDTVKDGDKVRGQAGFIFQNPQNQIILPILKEDIALGLKRQKLSRADTEAAVEAVLARFGIAHLADRRVHELSGGELQLAALASVLVTRPDILIMDEPTNQLDLRNRDLVERTIQGLDENVIVISHDLGLIADFDRVLLFHEGRLADDGAPAEVIARYRELAV